MFTKCENTFLFLSFFQDKITFDKLSIISNQVSTVAAQIPNSVFPNELFPQKFIKFRTKIEHNRNHFVRHFI